MTAEQLPEAIRTTRDTPWRKTDLENAALIPEYYVVFSVSGRELLAYRILQDQRGMLLTLGTMVRGALTCLAGRLVQAVSCNLPKKGDVRRFWSMVIQFHRIMALLTRTCSYTIHRRFYAAASSGPPEIDMTRSPRTFSPRGLSSAYCNATVLWVIGDIDKIFLLAPDNRSVYSARDISLLS